MVNFRVGLWLALILSGLFLPTAKAQPQVWIEGNQAFSQSDLGSYLRNRQIDLSLLANSADTDLQRARRLLEQFYRDRGFPLARVWLNPKPYNSRFGMNEGPRAELGEIRFRGNSRFAEKTLRQLFSGGDRLDFNELEADLEKVRALYRNWGYPRVHVGTPEVEVVERTQKDHFPLPFRDKSAPQADLTVPIREGPEFHVNRVAVPDGFPPEIPLPKPGDLYRESDLAELRNSITEYYFEMGKLLDGFQILEDFKDETATLDLMVLYKVLPELTVNRIEFRGNLRFPDSFYRRELALQEEQALDPRLLQTSLRALAQVGVLEGISADDVEIVIDRQNLTADVTINLQEKDRHSVFFAFGPDSLGGVDASLFYSVANLLGLGETLGVDLRVGSHTSEIAASGASRYLLGTSRPASLALRVFRRRSTFELPGVENLIRDLFTSDAEGVGLSTHYRIREGQTLGFDAGWERTRNPFQAQHFTLTPTWRRVHLNGNDTYSGFLLSNRVSFFDAESDVFTTRTDFSYQRSFDRADLNRSGGGYRFHLAHARFFGGSEPLFERILKDSDELRGFSFTAGPWAQSGNNLVPVGADTLASFSSEYQIPLPKSLSLVPYFDTGVSLASSGTPGTQRLLQETNRQWRASTGFEIRLRPLKSMPVTRLIFSWNPIRLDKILSLNGIPTRLRDPALSFRISFF